MALSERELASYIERLSDAEIEALRKGGLKEDGLPRSWLREEKFEGEINTGEAKTIYQAVRDKEGAEEVEENPEVESPTQEAFDEVEEDSPGEWKWDKGYVYNAAQDKYLFHLNQYEGAPYIVDGDQLRRMAKRYSKHHGDRVWHMDEVAAAEGIPVDAWQEIKSRMGITHRSPGHLPEDFQREDDIEGMAIEDVQKKKHAWKQLNEEYTLKELEKAAKKWFQFEGAIEKAARDLADQMNDYEPPTPNIRVTSTDNLRPAALILPIHDLHYGKYANEEETGSEYNREIAERRAHEAVESILEQAVRAARIEEIHTVCGTSDYLHIDVDKPPATTSGTPQDADGTFAEIVFGGQRLAIDLIEKMQSVAPTKVYYCPGNHAKRNSLWMHSYLKKHFQDREEVMFTDGQRGRQYFTYGKNRGVFFHGDAPKKQIKKIGNIIAREHGFGEYTLAISGHKHFQKAKDKAGLLMHQCPSLSGSDRWADDNLYSSLKALQGFVLDKERGPITSPTWYATN